MRPIHAITLSLTMTTLSRAGSDSIGPEGIRSNLLGLSGAGVVIGQVEPGRPGKPNFDMPQWVHSQMTPFAVYAGNSTDGPNSALVQGTIGAHATEVAGVLIAKGTPITLVEGVAPDAILHANGDGGVGDDSVFAVAVNRIARISDMRTINISEGRVLQPIIEATDGNTVMTQIIDWTAIRYNVLHVVAGSEQAGPAAIPQDNFNGITVGASQRVRNQQGFPTGHYRQVAPLNFYDEDAVGNRTSLDILAPGDDILLTSNADVERLRDGTSFAAPHVTGTAALLHQYATTQIDNGVGGWDPDNARRHEVMKSIILNSADKLNGVHGYNRTVVNENNQDWLSTTAYESHSVSLDEEMGVGHLNADSALDNFEPGEFGPGAVPRIGWDFGELGGQGSNEDYTFNKTVSGYVAITLAWDRKVELLEQDDTYSSGDEFIGRNLNDLDLYLLPSDTDNLNLAISRSVTLDDNVEHIFFEVPQGNYKIKVVHSGGLGEEQSYGLAWWAGESIPGDFDDDDDVDGDDLSEWEMDFGSGDGSDADGDGDSDGNDFLVWQQNVGTFAPAVSANAPVPEPSAWMLAVVGLSLLVRRRACLAR